MLIADVIVMIVGTHGEFLPLSVNEHATFAFYTFGNFEAVTSRGFVG
jgi:hypothetical protein